MSLHNIYKKINFADESIFEKVPGLKKPNNKYGFETETLPIEELVVLLFLFIEHIYNENIKLRSRMDALRSEIFALKMPVEKLRFKYKVA
jgi:hypothetical protein